MLAIVRNLLNNNLLENESPKVCYLTNFWPYNRQKFVI